MTKNIRLWLMDILDGITCLMLIAAILMACYVMMPNQHPMHSEVTWTR